MAGGFQLVESVRDNGAFLFGDVELIHKEFDAFGDFGGDEAFFEVGDGTVIAADDFVLGGAADGFVVGNAFADDVDAHVGGRVINVATGDAVDDFFENREGFEVAIIIDDLFTVVLEMEVINHVDIAEVGSGSFVGDVDGVLEGERPDREGFKLGVASVDAFFVFVIELGKAGGEFAGAGTRGGNDDEGSCGLDVGIGAVAFVGDNGGDVGGVAFSEGVEVGIDFVIL